MLQVRDVTLSITGRPILSRVSAGFQPGELVSVVGPNGAGKSTLLHVLMGLRQPDSGSVEVEHRALRDWPRAELARRISFVPQSVRIDFPFTAEEVVLMGRTPHAGGYFESGEDRAIALEAMRQTDCANYRCQDFRSLSGGERQRVVLAAALAQRAPALVLDEPTTFLDLKHQLSIYRLLQQRARAGDCVVTVTHDINLAAMFSDRVVVLCCGEVAANDAPAQALTPALLQKVFEVRAVVRPLADGQTRIEYET